MTLIKKIDKDISEIMDNNKIKEIKAKKEELLKMMDKHDTQEIKEKIIDVIDNKSILDIEDLRKMSVESRGSASSDVTNNYPKELLINADIIDIIKLQNKLNESDLGIKKKKIKKLKIYKIVPHIDFNEINFEDDENTKLNSGLTNEPLSLNLDITGKEVNIGIISEIISGRKKSF